jgi:CelD/BcsL family acetyltransferase involved in cellulose biosynthesis
VISPAASRASEIMDALIDLKRRQYLRTTGSDFVAKPGVQDFYRAMAMPDRLGRVSHLSALICGGKILAAHLGFIGRGRFYYVLPAFDTEYRSFATGLLLLDHLVESSRGEFATFDLGEGDSSYKEKWATHELPLWSCEQAKSAAGMLYRPLRRVRQFVDGGHFTELYGMSRTVKTVKQHAV